MVSIASARDIQLGGRLVFLHSCVWKGYPRLLESHSEMVVLLLVATLNSFSPTEGEITAAAFRGVFCERIWACSWQP